jgi:hypothetical protein
MEIYIRETLAEVEKKYGVTVLYACESGSRAWGFASPDSDYDVRFIYCHPEIHYLSLWEKTDSIEFFAPNDLDLSGWDLAKALRLLAKSNGALTEWLFSPVVYHAHPPALEQMQNLAGQCFSPIASTYHYLSMARKKADELVQSPPRLKTYFYALRAALCATWITARLTPPPVAFDGLLELLSAGQVERIAALRREKAASGEKNATLIPDEDLLFLQETLRHAEALAPSLPAGGRHAAELDDFFRQTIAAYGPRNA